MPITHLPFEFKLFPSLLPSLPPLRILPPHSLSPLPRNRYYFIPHFLHSFVVILYGLSWWLNETVPSKIMDSRRKMISDNPSI